MVRFVDGMLKVGFILGMSLITTGTCISGLLNLRAGIQEHPYGWTERNSSSIIEDQTIQILDLVLYSLADMEIIMKDQVVK